MITSHGLPLSLYPRPAPAAARKRRAPSGSTHYRAETENPNAPHLHSLPPPRFSGRYLNAMG
jgi:hypothetical protein